MQVKLTALITILVLTISVAVPNGYSQDTSLNKLKDIPDKYFTQLDNKMTSLDEELTRKSEKYLDKLISIQNSMLQKLEGTDQSLVKGQLTQSLDSLKKFKLVLGKPIDAINATTEKIFKGDYNAYLDTLTNSLDFLKDFKGFLKQGTELQEKLKTSLLQLQQLKQSLNQAEQVKQYIREQRERLKALTSNLKIPGLGKELSEFNKTVYYYQQQLHEWKEVFNDPRKAEQKALAILRKIPAFQEFMKKNSILAGLFNIPANYGQSLGGLQTQANVAAMIQGRIGSGPAASQFLSQQLMAAQSQLTELQNKFPFLDNAAEMPSFKPNELKTKSFKQRLEVGLNVQFNRANNILPTRSDIAGQVAYKFHKNGSFGVGAGYRLGLGRSLSDIQFTHEGVGFRGFIDTRLKGNFYINGGFEYNYYSSFRSITQVPNISTWQSSALVGLAKKIKIGKKMNKSIMIQYDFLHKQHIPYTEPLKIRIGYQF